MAQPRDALAAILTAAYNEGTSHDAPVPATWAFPSYFGPGVRFRSRSMLPYRLSLLACIVLGMAATVLMADDVKVEGDLKMMQGAWVSKDDEGESTWTFKEDRLSLKTPSRSYEIKVTLDPAAKPIPTMDLKTLPDSPNAPDYLAKAIYKFDAEKKLSICFGSAESDRPKEFKMDFPNSFLFELTKK
jgi:uncharacterized protein (TIGR03067 family)